MGKKSKAKRREFISEISRDGKISKKEGRKAAKKGISLRKIRNRRIGDYRQAAREFDRRAQSYRTPAAKRPTYEPLKIKRGAERADFARQISEYDNRGRRPDRNNKGNREPDKPTGFEPTPLPTDPDPAVPETPTPEGPSAEDLLADQIAEMQAGFIQSMQEQQSMFQQMQASQNDRMAALQQQMLQSQVNQSERPQVAGVKMADGSSGTATQIARRGMSGAFSRRGMRISSLNI
jgi:hypothetical protein